MGTGNPLIDLGSLNKLKASVKYTDFPSLNVTPSFLNAAGIDLTLDGDITRFLAAYTGRVPSPEAYLPATLTLNLLRTQPLSAQYKAQLEKSSLIGDCVVRVDAAGHPPYGLSNCGIQSVRALQINGQDAGWVVVVGGTYFVNSALWQ